MTVLIVNGYTIEARADLSNADLRGADLGLADLKGANLNYAELTRATMPDGTIRP